MQRIVNEKIIKKKHDFIVLRLTCAPDDQSLVQSFSQLFIDNPPPAGQTCCNVIYSLKAPLFIVHTEKTFSVVRYFKKGKFKIALEIFWMGV